MPAEAVRIERLDRFDESGVQRPPALPQERAVRDVVGERVRESVLRLREQAHLVEQLGRQQGRQGFPQGLFGRIGRRHGL